MLEKIPTRNAEEDASCQELDAKMPVMFEPDDLILVAIERINHTFHFDSCLLSGTAQEQMIGLKKRRFAKLGIWQLIAAHLLCKRPFIAIGTFGVSKSRCPSPLTWSLTIDTVDERCGSTSHGHDATQTPGQE